MRSAPKDFPTCMTLTIGMYFHSYTIMYSFVTIQQGVPRGLQGPLAGCGVSPPFSLTLPPEAVQEKRNLHSYKIGKQKRWIIDTTRLRESILSALQLTWSICLSCRDT